MTVTVKQERCYRLKELEAAAEQLQAALLAELDGSSQTGSTGSKKKSKAKKGKKKQVCTLQAATGIATLSCCSALIHLLMLLRLQALRHGDPCLYLSFFVSFRPCPCFPTQTCAHARLQTEKGNQCLLLTQRGTHIVHFSCCCNICQHLQFCTKRAALVTCLIAAVTTPSSQETTDVGASMACTLLTLLCLAAGFSSCTGGGGTCHCSTACCQCPHTCQRTSHTSRHLSGTIRHLSGTIRRLSGTTCHLSGPQCTAPCQGRWTSCR